MNRIRWLALATHVPPEGRLGGVVRVTVDMISAFSERHDVELHILARHDALPYLESAARGPVQLHATHRAPAAAGPVLDRYGVPRSLMNSVDVVHGFKHLLPQHDGPMKVLTVHDMLLLDRPRDFPLAKRTLLPVQYRRSIRDAELLLAVSQATRARLAHHVDRAAERTVVVPLAVSAHLLSAPSVPIEQLAGSRFALVVGDSSARKNLGTIVDGWASVRRKVPDAVLAIAGPPEWGRATRGDDFENLLREKAVIRLGHIPDEQLRWCYENARVVLCPSRAEGFGLPAIEAFTFRAPLIISSDAALVEVAADRALAVIPSDDGPQWSRATTAALLGAPRSAATPDVSRTWQQVADDVVAATRARLAG